MAKKTGIYKIVRASDGQVVYVGSSVDIDKRLKQHRGLLQRGKHKNAPLQEMYNRFGGLDFEFVAVETCPEQTLADKENDWIDALDPLCNSKLQRASRKRVTGDGNEENFIRKRSMWSHWFWKD